MGYTGVVLPVLEELREYFTLDRAGTRAKDLSEDDHRALRKDLDLSVQKREAAEILWQSGARAEALLLAREAVTLAERHAKLAPAVKVPPADAAPPLFEGDVRDDHVAMFDALVECQLAYHRALGGVALATDERKVRGRSRALLVGGVLAAAAWLAIVWYRRVDLTADASASWGPQYAAAFAVDDNEATHWLLPDKTLGYIEVKIQPPKAITTVSFINGYDPPAYGVKEYRVEAYDKNVLVRGVDGALPKSNGKPPWTDVRVDAKQPIDHIRIVVKSFHDLGGSVAEIKVK